MESSAPRAETCSRLLLCPDTAECPDFRAWATDTDIDRKITERGLDTVSRKNRRNRKEYKKGLGFNPDKYIGREHGTACSINRADCADHADRIDRASERCHTVNSASDNASAPRQLHNPSRGEVWFAQLGYHPGTSVQAGCRPVFVVSNDTGNQHATTIVVLPMTTSLKKSELPTHVELCQSNLTKADLNRPLADTMILAEQITTISKAALRNYIGKVEDLRKLNEIDNAVKVQLAI